MPNKFYTPKASMSVLSSNVFINIISFKLGCLMIILYFKFIRNNEEYIEAKLV